MALRVFYNAAVGSNVDISSRIRAYKLDVTSNAEQGSVALSTLAVDDPEGGINITGLHGIWLNESAEGSNSQRVYDGVTADRTITRSDSFRTGSSRLWTVQLADDNSIITRRIMRGSDANRPAETDVQRVQWLLGTTEFGTHVTTSRYVSTRFPVAMDAVDYRDQSNQQILDDCSQASGKNYFVFYDEPVSAYGLFYDFSGASPYRSSLKLTNVLGFIDNDIVFPVSEDSKLNRDPSRVYSGVILPYVGGEVYVQNSAIAANFFHRDTMAPSVNVKSQAKATARANRYIADAATEADVITTSVILPLAKVNHIMQGMAVQCWFAHFPGYDTGWNWMRVLNRQVVATSEEFYTVTLEMAAAVGGLDAGGGQTSEGATIPQPPVVTTTPRSCVALNGLTYNYTNAGTYAPLGPATTASVSGDTHYFFTSTSTLDYTLSASTYPNPGQVRDAGNGGIAGCIRTVGGFDYFSGGNGFVVHYTLIGPGTLSVLTAAHIGGLFGSCPSGVTITATAQVTGSVIVVDTDSGAPGATLTLDIPADGYCAHYVEIYCPSGSWGLGSATWTPA